MVDISRYTDGELNEALSEINDWHDTGVLCDGLTRNLAREMKNKIEGTVLDLMAAEMVIYREIAKRWRVERGFN